MSNAATHHDELRRDGWESRPVSGHMGEVGPLWTRREGDDRAYGLWTESRHLNAAGVVHGGAIASVIDHALSSIAWHACGRIPCLTVQLGIQYLEPVYADQLLVVRGRVLRKGSSLLFLDGAAKVGDTIVAAASLVMKVVGSSMDSGAAA